MSKKITGYQEVDEVLCLLTKGIKEIFGDNLVGFYLMGSLTYDDFNPDRSDIDLVAILSKSATNKEVQQIKKFHYKIEENNEKWIKRIESQYVPIEFFKRIHPPKTPRPYYGEGILYPKAHFGNEWLINNYLLYKHGITLLGKDFKELVDSIDIKEVKKACVRDLLEEWKPKISDPDYLDNPHYQSYVVLNLCRILYTIANSDVASKTKSAEWTKKKHDQWIDLIETAEKWSYGKKMKFKKETKEFIKFVIAQVNKLPTTLRSGYSQTTSEA